MSKIGKKPIQILKGLEVKVDGVSVSVKGPKGEIKKNFDSSVSISINGDQLVIGLQGESRSKEKMAIWGLTRALLANMIKGAADGFEKSLEFEGVGYKANVKGE